MGITRVLGTIALALLIALCGFTAYAWRSELPAIARPQAASFDHALVKRGAALAALGNCNTCHTRPGGEVYAGGLAISTPFGTIYSTNITPDPETGIGRWSEAAFIRSMREGVDRQGRHLYPAFPYDHFTLVSDDDNRALYAFLMSRKAVRYEPPPKRLPFPLNIRMLLAGWKLLFFREGVFQPDPHRDAEWNRGAYLAEGLEHCGACHTPRNLLGAEKKGEHWAGAVVDGWTAYAINGASPAPVPWDAEALDRYLANGWHEHHGVARGPMAPVTANMGSVPERDVRAVVAYVASVMGKPAPERIARGADLLRTASVHPPGAQAQSADSQIAPTPASASRGEAIYGAACSNCHDAGRAVPYGGLPMRLSTAINGPTPLNPINVVLYGLPAVEGERGPIMPGFAGALNDGQMADLLDYMRAKFSDKPAWTGTQDLVRQVRTGADDTQLYALPTGSRAPANPSKRETSW